MLLEGHTQRIGVLRFGADSDVLLSASNDKTVRVWDLGAGDEKAISATSIVLAGHEGVVSGVGMSPDGRFVVSSSYDRTARVWPLLPSDLIPIGCRKVGRSLTLEEWERFFKTPFQRACG